LVHEPRIIFADEPTGALDTVTEERVLNLLLATASERRQASCWSRMMTGSPRTPIANRDPRWRRGQDGPAQYYVQATQATDRHRMVAALATVPGVRGAYLNRHVLVGCRHGVPCLTGFVGSCHDIQIGVPESVGCRDDALAWIDDRGATPPPLGRDPMPEPGISR
jgi:hypothetical protein